MKRFFNWLLTFFRSDSKKFVKNIQADKTSFNKESGYSGTRRKHFSNGLLAWAHPSSIKENEKDNQGVAVAIKMNAGAGFKVLKLSESPHVVSKKKGLSTVAHSLEFTIDPTDDSAKELIEQAENKKPLCFLYRSVYGDISLIGEKNGLELKNFDGSEIKFSGEESDVFFHVAEECLNELLPNIEK